MRPTVPASPRCAVRWLLVALLVCGAVALEAGTAPADPLRPVPPNGSHPQLTGSPRLVERAAFVDESEGGEAALFRPSYFVFDAEGNAYIPDTAAHAIVVFDRDLHLVRRFGREGEGPGELKWPCAVRMTPDGLLAVHDPENQRISYFSTSGEFLRSDRFSRGQTITLTSNDDYIPVLDGGHLRVEWFYHRSDRPGRESDRSLLEIVDGQDRVIRRLGERRQHEDGRIADLLNSVVITASASGKAVAAFAYSPEIHVYDLVSGELEMSVIRDLDFEPAEPAVEEKVYRSPDGRSTSIRTEPVADTVFLDVAVDEAGRIWVMTRRVDQEVYR